jgi:lipoteichoic acid synthase
MRRRKQKQMSPLLMVACFSFVVLYLEIVFSLSTVGGIFKGGFWYTMLFSIVYGTIGYLLSSIFKNKKINFWVSNIWMIATVVLYIVQFLIYKQFKQFYDINTMSGGAGDMFTSYFKELLVLVFLRGGIFIMALMAAPVVLNILYGRKFINFSRTPLRIKGLAAALAVLCHLLCALLIAVHPINGPVYNDQYNFQSAVSTFGLVTGMRLDAQKTVFGGDLNFDNPEFPVDQFPQVDSTDPTDETTEPPVVYGDNVLNIDFDALNKKASSKQKKLNEYVRNLTPSKQNEFTGLFKGKNMIFITAEAFSAELIDPELMPTLYRLATKGFQFTDYYQPASAGTTGGEYQNIFGMLPMDGGKSFKNTADHYNYYTLGTQLDLLGYYGKAFHNNSYTYYSRNKTHVNIGYSDGFMGYGNGMEEYVKKAWPQSDYQMISGTVPTFIDKQPFNVYYMSVSGHNNYSPSSNSQTKKHWDRVQHLPYSDTIKGYYAANLDLEDALTWLVAELETKGIADDTVIVIASDHFPYGLDSDAPLGKMPYLSELYGYEVLDYFQRDHNRLIMWCGILEDMEPIVIDSPTFSLDILPTLFNLFGVEYDSRLLPGRDVFSDTPALVYRTNYDWKTDLGTYYASKGKFVPVSEDVEIPEDYVKTIKAIVKNRVSYCDGVLETDYFRHVFGKK